MLIRNFSILLFLAYTSLNAELLKECFPHPDQPEHQIECFYMIPEGAPPFPAIFLLHGYQPPSTSSGGQQMAEIGMMKKFLNMGIVPIAFSTPGFGGSEGERDFNGPFSQKALIASFQYFEGFPFVDKSRMGAYGISRGAALLSMATTMYHKLQFQILESGCYDLTTRKSLLPKYLGTIWENVVRETAGASHQALIERSAVFHADQIQTPTLILHGKFDDRRGLPSARHLYTLLQSNHQDAQLRYFPQSTHLLPREKWETITPYVRRHFFHLSGIGVNLIPSPPTVQIEKILPDALTPISGTLRVGDAILTISPNDNEEETSTLMMPFPKIIQLILGKPGTRLRLHVQHFDHTFEDIILQRQ